MQLGAWHKREKDKGAGGTLWELSQLIFTAKVSTNNWLK
jgi:hypothetical protein